MRKYSIIVYIAAMETTNQQNSSNTIISIVFIVTGIFVGLLLTMQFKSSIPTSVFPTDELEAQQNLIESYIADQALLKTKIVNLRSQIDEAQQQSEALIQDNNLETLKSLKKEMGLESIRGKGVEISLSDGAFVNRESSESISQSLIHASDLRDIVNVLRTAKAEGISINDQRVIASTPITSVGNTILVNNFHLLPPFTVSAVGDQELLTQRLNDPTSLPDLQKRSSELKIQFVTELKEGVNIPIYNGNLSTKYLSVYKETEV